MALIPQHIVEWLAQMECEDVARRLGIKTDRNHKAFCFLHEEKIPSLSFNPRRKNMWKCFSCNSGGNAIQLVMAHQALDFVDACKLLCSLYGIPLSVRAPGSFYYKPPLKSSPSVYRREDEVVEKEFDREMAGWLLNNLFIGDKAADFLFKQRKLKEEVVVTLNIKSIDDPRPVRDLLVSRFGSTRCLRSGLLNERGNLCLWTPCLLFPYYDADGLLVGLQSRYLGENPKAPRFQFLSREKTRLFNMQSLTKLRSGEPLYITEGITDCLAMLSAGKNAVAIPSATLIPKQDLYRLRKYHLTMMADNDNAGWEGYLKLKATLIKNGIMLWREEVPDGYKDFGDFWKNKS